MSKYQQFICLGITLLFISSGGLATSESESVPEAYFRESVSPLSPSRSLFDEINPNNARFVPNIQIQLQQQQQQQQIQQQIQYQLQQQLHQQQHSIYAPPLPPLEAVPARSQEKIQFDVPECRSNFIDSNSTTLCIPNVVTDCQLEKVFLKRAVPKSECVKLKTPVCQVTPAEMDTESNTCVLQYRNKNVIEEIPFPKVKYHKRCDVTNYQTICKKHVVVDKRGYFKEENSCTDVPLKTCLNIPKVTDSVREIEITYPEPEDSCDTKVYTFSTLNCQEKEEEYCYETVELEDYEEHVEVCNTTIAEPKCEDRVIALPEEICVTHKERADISAAK